MLAVAVDLGHVVVVVLVRVDETGLDGAADAEVERQPDHRSRRPRLRPLPVSSVEPSSITTTSNSGARSRSDRTTLPTVAASLYAGTTARNVLALDAISAIYYRGRPWHACRCRPSSSPTIRSPSCGGRCRALLAELDPDDELIVVDNASGDGAGRRAREHGAACAARQSAENVGFAGGANHGAAAARRDLLVLLNPDAIVQPGWREAIRSAVGRRLGRLDGRSSLLDDGVSINTSGGVLHFTGFGWAGQVGEPVQAAPADRGRSASSPARAWRSRARRGRSTAAFRSSSSCIAKTSICR